MEILHNIDKDSKKYIEYINWELNNPYLIIKNHGVVVSKKKIENTINKIISNYYKNGHSMDIAQGLIIQEIQHKKNTHQIITINEYGKYIPDEITPQKYNINIILWALNNDYIQSNLYSIHKHWVVNSYILLYNNVKQKKAIEWFISNNNLNIEIIQLYTKNNNINQIINDANINLINEHFYIPPKFNIKDSRYIFQSHYKYWFKYNNLIALILSKNLITTNVNTYNNIDEDNNDDDKIGLEYLCDTEDEWYNFIIDVRKKKNADITVILSKNVYLEYYYIK